MSEHGFPGGPTQPPFGPPLPTTPPPPGTALPPRPPSAAPPTGEPPPPSGPPSAAPPPPATPQPPDPRPASDGSDEAQGPPDDDGLPTFEEVLAGPHRATGGPRRPSHRERASRGPAAAGSARGAREGARRSTERSLGRRVGRWAAVTGGVVVAGLVGLLIIGLMLPDEVEDIGGGAGQFAAVDLEHCEALSTDPDDEALFVAGEAPTVDVGASEGLGGPVWSAPHGRGDSRFVPVTTASDTDVVVAFDDHERGRIARYVAETGELVHQRHLAASVGAAATDVLWFVGTEGGNTLVFPVDLTDGTIEVCFAATADDDEDAPPLTLGSGSDRFVTLPVPGVASDEALYVGVTPSDHSRPTRVHRLGRDGAVHVVERPGRTVAVGVADDEVHVLAEVDLGSTEVQGLDPVSLEPRWSVPVPQVRHSGVVARTVAVDDGLALVTLETDRTLVTPIDVDGGRAGASYLAPFSGESLGASDGQLYVTRLSYSPSSEPAGLLRYVDGEGQELPAEDLDGQLAVAHVGPEGVVVAGSGFSDAEVQGVLLVDGERVATTAHRMGPIGGGHVLVWVEEGFGRGYLVALSLDPDAADAADDQDEDDGAGGGDGEDDDEAPGGGGGGGDDEAGGGGGGSDDEAGDGGGDGTGDEDAAGGDDGGDGGDGGTGGSGGDEGDAEGDDGGWLP